MITGIQLFDPSVGLDPALTDAYEEAQKAKRAAENAMSKVARDIFGKRCREFFAALPAVESFSWTQYTPYFNDGDSCTFSVNSDPDYIEINGEEVYEHREKYDDRQAYQNCCPEYLAAEKACAILNDFEDELMQEMFEDHSKVTIKRDGSYEIDEYSHD